MATRNLMAGGAVCLCWGLIGCVTEPGKTGPALWTTVDTQSENANVRLKNPVLMHTSYGRVAEANGRRNVARKHYETALSHDPKCVDAIVGIARLDLVGGQTRRAELGFQKALKLAPKNPDVLQSAGLFYSSQGRWRKAVASLNAAVAAAPNVAKYRYALAMVMAKSGDLNGAMPHLVASVGKAEAHSQMARVLLERGDRDRAAQQLQVALSLQPNLESARQLLNRLRTDDRRRYLARAETPAIDRGPVRAVGHVSMSGDSRPQFDRRREDPRQYGGQPPYDQQRAAPRYDDGRTLRIVPGTPYQQQGGTLTQPAPQGPDDRFRPPTQIDGRGYQDPSVDSIPQWNHQGRNE
jgi:tetratricopeptide (TPR) repeat protein